MRTVHNLEKNKVKRKALRKEPTPQEIILWSRIKNSQLRFKFRRQHGIGEFIVDFYCPEKRLIIEIDGSQHIDQEKYDNKRTKYFSNMGYRVLRFWNNEINTNIEGVIMKIQEKLNTSPPPRKASAPPLD